MAQTITLNFKIIGQSLERLDNNKIVEKAKNYVNAHFEFNELWDDTTKAILIEVSGLRYKVYLNENNECLIPNRVVRHDGFTLAVVGEDSEKFITITTNELYIAVGKGIKSDEEMESIYEITSQSLDVNKNGGTCNLEIKDEEKFYYEMQENDFSNMQHESGNQWSLDLSETLENVITEFKKRIGVDWDRLGIPSPVPNMPKCVYTPTKKVISVGEEEITYYVLSAVDGYGDTSANFYYQNDSWHVIFATGNLIDNETLNIRLENKQDVLEAGTGITIEGNTISATGGEKKYLHNLHLTVSNTNYYIVATYQFINNSNTPITVYDLYTLIGTNTYFIATGVVKNGTTEQYQTYPIGFARELKVKNSTTMTLYYNGLIEDRIATNYSDINNSSFRITDIVTEV